MLGPMLVVFLLLLPPSPLRTTRSTLHRYPTQDQGHHPSSRLQESPADGESCWSTYDVYFVLDSSQGVHNWMFTQSFVRNLVNGFKNPEQRMSFITYSTDGHVNMQLTSDRNKINTALVDLFHVIPSGTINMQHGLKKANEQIERTRAAGERVPSLIIALTGGPLLPESFAETKVEAEKSRQLGATLYLVGVQDYQKYQLLEIARTVGHALAVDTGYSGLEDIIDPLIVRSCVEITSVDFSSLCTRGKEIVKVIGKGFQGVRKDDVVCQFRTGKETIRMKAVSVEDTSITCPGLKMSNLDWAVFIDVSLDNGLTFIETDLDVSRRSCVTPREGTPPTLLDTTPPPAQKRALPDGGPEDKLDTQPNGGPPKGVFLSLHSLYWAVPLLTLPFLLVLCCCIWQWRSKSSPAPLAQKCPSVVVPCCRNPDKEKIREPERCDSAVPLVMPHCESLSCGTWIYHRPSCHCSHFSRTCSWCRAAQPICCQRNDAIRTCYNLDALESSCESLSP
ncbi:anthrax toxin receptor-like isoform X2 [Manis pentadactyla]|uniref:anthrax toxin receptor-like isoform X2 n=1 Tax=Manis pentadactyla TaxID=143292 RepID=UPI00255C8948|nr:anthrax toxin receptor-like isoform X2 [Manis pentadactyla]